MRVRQGDAGAVADPRHRGCEQRVFVGPVVAPVIFVLALTDQPVSKVGVANLPCGIEAGSTAAFTEARPTQGCRAGELWLLAYHVDEAARIQRAVQQ